MKNTLVEKEEDYPGPPSSSPTLLRLHHDQKPLLRRCLPKVRLPALGEISFLGVTGGVYKARERIHRRMADRRLLAIPASCRRVAACNPN